MSLPLKKRKSEKRKIRTMSELPKMDYERIPKLMDFAGHIITEVMKTRGITRVSFQTGVGPIYEGGPTKTKLKIHFHVDAKDYKKPIYEDDDWKVKDYIFQKVKKRVKDVKSYEVVGHESTTAHARQTTRTDMFGETGEPVIEVEIYEL